MTTNKERIERIEADLGNLQDRMEQMEVGINDKLQRLEETINKLVESNNATKGTTSRNSTENSSSTKPAREERDAGRHMPPTRITKLEFPHFTGDDPTEWYSRVSHYFEYQETMDEHKVTLAAYHLEGEANQWCQWMRRDYEEEKRPVTWKIFVEELWARFGPTECEDFDEALSRVRQTGSLREYQKEFERLGNQVHGWSQKALVGTFMGGLKPEIAEDIRMFRPRTLKEAISLARMKDDQIARQKKIIRSSIPIRSPYALNRATTTTPYKRLSWEEMQRRRAQGLCFNCNDKFTAGHKCTKAQLLILECETTPEEGLYEEFVAKEPIMESTKTVNPKITLYALSGWAAPQTMRVMAKIGQYAIVILIDSWSTHNFISSRLANLLQLPIKPTTSFSVQVANGAKLTCQGMFEKVQILIQNIPFSLTVYSLPITGLDMVLGIQWLETLGSVVCNWKDLTMEFEWEDKKQRLQGINPHVVQSASVTEVAKEIKQGQGVYAICFYTSLEDSFDKTHICMQQILVEYSELFQEPRQLPPSRDIDHNIPLKEGTEPVNVRPYRYPYFQKSEIEKQVQEMLNSGLIRPSTSPFSSPVLLVKKKDGSWRFCTDYRALNQVTIKDRFPIPTVEDMLDELHSAAYFTKLDLRAGYHQVRVNPADIYKTAFQTHNGHYEYLSYMEQTSGSCSVAHSLTNLLKKGQFVWNSEAEEAFEKLKKAMSSTPTLAMPNFHETFIVETDASGEGIGAVLQQQGRPIAYMSHALSTSKKGWSIYNKEMLAIVEAVRRWRPYLLGHRFIIKTDQQSINFFLEQQVATPEQHKWMSKLMGYDYEIVYRPGRENKAADALSRRSDTQNQTPGPYTVRNGLLFFKERVVVPRTLRESLLYEAHDTKIGGHSGVLRTYKCLSQQFYWPAMFQAVREYVSECKVCQQVKFDTLKPAGLLQPLPIPCQVWDDISLDFVEGLPSSQGKDTILVVVDRLIAYKLQLPESSRIHLVFHVSLLKKAIGDFSSSTDLPSVDDEGLIVLEPLAILDTRWLRRGGKVVEQQLVQWKRLPVEDATWEDTELLQQQFPHMTLEDKGTFREEGNDKKQPQPLELRKSSRGHKPNPKYVT
ncbi:hypothetical protein KPL71_023390 [Citrus sinensis]|uniref:Uncharacterized protein n=1 Tax=Citrus sinensis TaxID=2711 RepID=A0ACB8IJ32_CITSI|nr:hypothetical protein KPL71_023390 [Citrus sinensis]